MIATLAIGAHVGIAHATEPFSSPSNEIVASRDAVSTTYINADGSKTARIYGRVVNVKGADGTWHEADTAIKQDGSGYRGNEDSAPLHLRFPGQTGDGDIVSASGAAWSAGFDLTGKARGRPASVDGNTIQYRDVLPNLDLRYLVAPDRIKEEAVLSAAPGGNTPVIYTFPLHLSGLAATNAANGVVLTGSDGKVVARIPNGEMWDADPSHPTGIVDVRLVGHALQVSPDSSWLRDPSRAYPVTIDPSLVMQTAAETDDAWIQSSVPDGNNGAAAQLRMGYNSDWSGNPAGEGRGLVRYDLSSIAGTDIISARWNGYFTLVTGGGPAAYDAYPLSQDWDEFAVTWNTRPNAMATEKLSGSATNAQWSTLDITTWVRNWTSGAWANDGFRVNAQSPTDPSQFKRVASSDWGTTSQVPHLDVTYNNRTSEAVPISPSSFELVPKGETTLTVDDADDLDGDQVSYLFRVATSPDAETGVVADSGWIDDPAWLVPNGILQTGQTYYWHAYTKDSLETTSPTWVRAFVAKNTPAPEAGPVAPMNRSFLCASIPTLQSDAVTDLDGDPVKYLFRVATGSDGETGVVADSGWISSSSWQLPATVASGAILYWHVYTSDGVEATAPQWTASFVPACGAQVPAPYTHTFIQFNMCGQASSCANRGDPNAASTVINKVNEYDPSWVTLNEVCRNQAARIQSTTGYSMKFIVSKPSGCNVGGVHYDYGISLFWKASIPSGSSYTSPLFSRRTSSETRMLGCQELGSRAPYYLCVTHLDSGQSDAYRAPEAEDVASWMAANLKKGRPTLLGGDFNDVPTSTTLSYLYAPYCVPQGSTGGMEEAAKEPCQRAGQPTHQSGKKIDYEFFHTGAFQGQAEMVVPVGSPAQVGGSDHRMVIGYIGQGDGALA